ncbi:MAG: hypothetical protein GC202_12070 [Alphaproteobacteria bacterium]|nr:hypothetical protein [Alphaproteobacteria bacterium]
MRLRDTLVLSAIIIATAASAELGARVWTWQAPHAADNAGDSLGNERYGFNFKGPGDLIPNQDGHWIIWWRRPYHVETNSQGFRVAEEPAPDSRKIVAIGDSQTFGPYVANEDTWPAWMQSELRRRQDSQSVQVFNAGVSGYTIADELAWLKDKGTRLKPNLILLGVFENDVLDYRRVLSGHATRIAVYDETDGWLARLRVALWQNSALYNVASALKRRLQFQMSQVDLRRGEGDAALTRPEPNSDFSRYAAAYERDFREFVRVAEEARIPVAVVAIPSYDTIVSGTKAEAAPIVARLCTDLGIPFLDLAPIVAALPDPGQSAYLLQWSSVRRQLDGNGHLSRFGHLHVGHAIAQWILDTPLLRESVGIR